MALPQPQDKARVIKKILLKGSAKTVAEYFEYSLHAILFQRGVYPNEDFTTVKKYGLNMLVSSNDEVKTYIKQLMSHVNKWTASKKLSKFVVILVHKDTEETDERWDFGVEILDSPPNPKSHPVREKGPENENSKPSAKEAQQLKAQRADEPAAAPEKSDVETQKEIQAIFRQITASVTFLPMLDGGSYTFNVLVFTDASTVVPLEWGDSEDKQVTGRSEKVQLRSFSTNDHRVDTFVTYKVADDDD